MSPRDRRDDGDVGRARSRLEEAVNDLVASAGESAAGYIERAAERVREQVRRGPADDPDRRRGDYRHRRRREPAWLWSAEPRSATLYRDTRRGKLLGVCAGIGRYYGIEAWVVRCIAITGVIFLNWIVVVAYLVAGFVLDPEPAANERESQSAGNADARNARRTAGAHHRAKGVNGDLHRYASPSPLQQLRSLGADFDEMELRLRRMETHITSGRYELHREFGRIDDGATPVN